MNILGPRRRRDELPSEFRLRYALFCLAWLAGLVAAYAGLLVWNPSVERSSPAFVALFFHIGLPIGAATALVACLGFLVSGLWSRVVERHATVARRWPPVRETLRVLVIAPIAVFAGYVVVQAAMTLQVLFPSRRHYFRVDWTHDPLWFAVALAFWTFCAIVLPVYLYRHLRVTFAAERGAR